ncbi:MAG: hypothetical protein ABGZ17_09710 [Planctomycetaceae bacterium]
MSSIESAIVSLMGREVVVDVSGPFVFAGTLVDLDQNVLSLERADVHDLRDSTTTRERYIMETRMHGVRVNRQQTFVLLHQVVSVSALEDVLA